MPIEKRLSFVRVRIPHHLVTDLTISHKTTLIVRTEVKIESTAAVRRTRGVSSKSIIESR
jgi:hypothetical protein